MLGDDCPSFDAESPPAPAAQVAASWLPEASPAALLRPAVAASAEWAQAAQQVMAARTLADSAHEALQVGGSGREEEEEHCGAVDRAVAAGIACSVAATSADHASAFNAMMASLRRLVESACGISSRGKHVGGGHTRWLTLETNQRVITAQVPWPVLQPWTRQLHDLGTSSQAGAAVGHWVLSADAGEPAARAARRACGELSQILEAAVSDLRRGGDDAAAVHLVWMSRTLSKTMAAPFP
jgi:hypothetical protein